jgi:energy-coupling factor transporter ATP-binding protein EcfA2
MEVSLRCFDLKQIKDDATIMVVGKRGAGKSTILKHIMYTKRHIPFGIACSGTEEGNGAFGQVMPSLFVYPDYDSKAVQRVIDRQRKLSKTEQGCSPSFVILDDCMYEPGILKKPEMRQLFLNGRHFKFFTAVTAQFAGDVPPAIRVNIDYLFLCRENILQNRRRIWENFFGLIDFAQFQTLMDRTTENYEVLVLDNTCKSNKLEDAVYWFKARTDLPPFKMGCKAFWEYARSHEAKDGGADDGKKNQASKKITITVKKMAPSEKKKKTSQKGKK